MEKKFFTTSDLAFAGAALLTDGITLCRVVFRDAHSGTKIFFLSPEEKAKALYLRYISDDLLVSPIQLSQKISVLKNMLAEPPEVD